MTPTVTAIRRYPVKGLSGEDLPAVELVEGRALPLDRAYGLLHGPAALDSEREGWRPAADFFTLERTEKLALLDTEFDADTHSLIVRRGGRQVTRGRLDQMVGRMLVEQFFAAYLDGLVPGMPKLVAAKGCAFTELEEPTVTLLNLASVRDLEERVAKQPVDPRRFRANLLIDGLEPWVERHWVGRVLDIGGASLRLVAPMEYSPAWDVNPTTGARDFNALPVLERGYGHSRCGVHAQVVKGGRIALGDPVSLV
jgi:uncharacterized protein YcbX